MKAPAKRDTWLARIFDRLRVLNAAEREERKERKPPSAEVERLRAIKSSFVEWLAPDQEQMVRRVAKQFPTANLRSNGNRYEVYEPATGFVRARAKSRRAALRMALRGAA